MLLGVFSSTQRCVLHPLLPASTAGGNLALSLPAAWPLDPGRERQAGREAAGQVSKGGSQLLLAPETSGRERTHF